MTEQTPTDVEQQTRQAVADDIKRLAHGIIDDPKTTPELAKSVGVLLGLAAGVALKGLR